MKKRIIALSLALTLAMTCTLAVNALAPVNHKERVPLRNTLAHSSAACDQFTDVSATHWGRANIAYVVDRGLFHGTSATTFRPEDTMSRAMLCTALYRWVCSR